MRCLRLPHGLALLAVLGGLLLALAGCGDDEPEGPGNGTDLAFIDAMIPHHESAVGMAEVALAEGDAPFVKSLARDIVRTQNAEISTMRRLRAQIAQTGVSPGELDHEMHLDGMDGASLRGADPFDREFVDKMIPHHRDAVVMAREELADGQNADLKRLAEAMVDAQAREIEEMNAFRRDRFGAPSPAGGVPEEADGNDGHGGHG